MAALALRQGGLLSSPAQLAAAQETLHQKRGRCAFCRKCRIGFFLAQACIRKDPYAIAAFFRLAEREGVVVRDAQIALPVDEALAWIGSEARAGTVVRGSVPELIRRWRRHEAIREDELKRGFKDSRLVWTMLLMKASLIDGEGDAMRARQAFEIAYKATPGWLPESAAIRDKLNALTNLSVEDESPV